MINAGRSIDPICAVPRLEDILDPRRRIDIANAVCNKFRAIEPGKPVARTKPHESARVAIQVVDKSAPQAIGGSIKSYGQTLRKNRERAEQQGRQSTKRKNDSPNPGIYCFWAHQKNAEAFYTRIARRQSPMWVVKKKAAAEIRQPPIQSNVFEFTAYLRGTLSDAANATDDAAF